MLKVHRSRIDAQQMFAVSCRTGMKKVLDDFACRAGLMSRGRLNSLDRRVQLYGRLLVLLVDRCVVAGARAVMMVMMLVRML